MNPRLVLGYFVLGICVIVLAVGAFIVISNIGRQWEMQLLWGPVSLSTASLLLLIAAAGAVIWLVLTLVLPEAVSQIQSGREQRRLKQAKLPKPPATQSEK